MDSMPCSSSRVAISPWVAGVEVGAFGYSRCINFLSCLFCQFQEASSLCFRFSFCCFPIDFIG